MAKYIYLIFLLFTCTIADQVYWIGPIDGKEPFDTSCVSYVSINDDDLNFSNMLRNINYTMIPKKNFEFNIENARKKRIHISPENPESIGKRYRLIHAYKERMIIFEFNKVHQKYMIYDKGYSCIGLTWEYFNTDGAYKCFEMCDPHLAIRILHIIYGNDADFNYDYDYDYEEYKTNFYPVIIILKIILSFVEFIILKKRVHSAFTFLIICLGLIFGEFIILFLLCYITFCLIRIYIRLVKSFSYEISLSTRY